MAEDVTEGTITSLEPQVNNDDRVSVYLDDEFAFGAHEDVVVKYGLRVGQTLTPEDRRDIEADEQYVRAKQRALDYLAHKPRTEQEVRRKLRERDVAPFVVDQVIARLQELDYLDDEAYAHEYAHNRFSNKGYGPIRIRRELEERGVNRAVADAAVDDLFAEEDATAAAREHAENRWPRLAGEDDPRSRKQKMYRYLRRRGFTTDTIYTVLDELERRDVAR